jgi:hypothetical protein
MNWLEGPFTVRYNPGALGYWVELFGTPVEPHYEVVDMNGLVVALFTEGHWGEANAMAYAYNKLYLVSKGARDDAESS